MTFPRIRLYVYVITVHPTLKLFTDFIVNINAIQFMDLANQFFIDSSMCSLTFIIDKNGNGVVGKGNNDYECRHSFHD